MDYRYKLDNAAIAQRIKDARKHVNITQAELAEKIGISTNAVAKLETNIMTASLQTIISIANVFCIDINYLLFDKSSMNNANTSIDIFCDSLIQKLSQKDKEFIIHIINGLRVYNSDNNSK